MNYWVQETMLVGTRQAIIHEENCPICVKRITKGSSDDHWLGPVATVRAAKDISYGLWAVAMRSECRCVRSAVVQAEEEARRKEKAEAEKPKHDTKAKPRKHTIAARYSAFASAALVLLMITPFLFPALSVVEASSRTGSAGPFLLANDSPLPVTDVQADCTVELQPAAVRLQNNHQHVADRLSSRNQASIPCFQGSGGAVPQTNGVTVQVTVNYAVFGIGHLKQTFSFVAARTSDGLCRWVYKS